MGVVASGDTVCQFDTFDWTVCCHGSSTGLRWDVCPAPGSNTAPTRWSVSGSTTCSYHAPETLMNVYSRTVQRLRPRYTNSIIYASINISCSTRQPAFIQHTYVRTYAFIQPSIYSVAQLLSSRFCLLNFIFRLLSSAHNNFILAYNWTVITYGNTCACVPFSDLLEPQINQDLRCQFI